MAGLKYILFCIWSLFLLASCDSGSPKEESSLPSLKEGSWRSECSPAPGGGNFRVEVSLSSTGTYFAETTYYSDSCVSLSRVVRVEGAYSLASGGAFQEINYTLSDIRIKPVMVSVANQLNSDLHCGISNWAAGTWRSVAGLSCDGETLSAGDESFDIYQINGSGQLFFGLKDSTYDGQSPGSRPVALDEGFPFRKR